MVKILPLNQFRRLKDFAKVFKIDNNSVIAYGNVIYSNKNLYKDVYLHELVHLRQQKAYGLHEFVDRYLVDKDFRLKMEGEAYREQIDSIKDEGLRNAVISDIITGLTSGLYGKVTEKEAKELLGIQEPRLDVNKLI